MNRQTGAICLSKTCRHETQSLLFCHYCVAVLQRHCSDLFFNSGIIIDTSEVAFVIKIKLDNMVYMGYQMCFARGYVYFVWDSLAHGLAYGCN